MFPEFGFAAGGPSEASRDITPTPRRYAVTEFRSTLEADWAATLDSLGIAWEYEPQTVTLPNGVGYIPDFWLPEIGAWLEVKGDDVPGLWKAEEFAKLQVCACAGDCYCAWPGGEIVLIGTPSYRPAGERLRFGAARWYDALVYNALLVTCGSCFRQCWVRPRHCLACRHCGAYELDGSHLDSLLNVGDVEFHHADRIPGTEV